MSHDLMTQDRAVSGSALLGHMDAEPAPIRASEPPLRRDRTARGVADDAPKTQVAPERIATDRAGRTDDAGMASTDLAAGGVAGAAAGPRRVAPASAAERAQSTPPGWYPDPTDGAGLRWWTGVGWTGHTSVPAESSAPTAQSSAVAPAAASAAPVGPDAAAPDLPAARDGVAPMVFTPLAPHRVHTVAVWAIAFAPLIVAAGEYAIAGDVVPQDPLGVRIVSVGALIAISLVLAVIDRSRLRDGWHSDTASPWWNLLTPLAYLIGRTVRVRQETGVRATGATMVWGLMLLPAVAIAFAWDGLGALIALL